MDTSNKATAAAVIKLLAIIARLRHPQKGCPWDKKQTHASLKPYLIEETYETLEAIDHHQPEVLAEELGDLLLQIVLHAQIASEKNEFDFKQIVETVSAKMTRRHPHVFENTKVKDIPEVWKNWELIKRSEKNKKDGSRLSGIPKSLPGLLKAQKLQKKAARVGFDWHTSEETIPKIKEELAELEQAFYKNDAQSLKQEAGDILFSIINLFRKLDIDTESALQMTNKKFLKRFQKMEELIAKDKKVLEKMPLEELDKYWEKAKNDLHR